MRDVLDPEGVIGEAGKRGDDGLEDVVEGDEGAAASGSSDLDDATKAGMRRTGCRCALLCRPSVAGAGGGASDSRRER